MNQPRVLRDELIGMMIDDDPVRLVQPRFEAEVRPPGGFLAQLTLFPSLIVIRLQPYLLAEKMFGQSLQQETGEKTVQVTLMRQNHGWFGQRTHRVAD